jgi:hypothetical protein
MPTGLLELYWPDTSGSVNAWEFNCIWNVVGHSQKSMTSLCLNMGPTLQCNCVPQVSAVSAVSRLVWYLKCTLCGFFPLSFLLFLPSWFPCEHVVNQSHTNPVFASDFWEIWTKTIMLWSYFKLGAINKPILTRSIVKLQLNTANRETLETVSVCWSGFLITVISFTQSFTIKEEKKKMNFLLSAWKQEWCAYYHLCGIDFLVHLFSGHPQVIDEVISIKKSDDLWWCAAF